MPAKRSHSMERGISLIAVLVAVGIMGIVSIGMMKVFENLQRGNLKISRDADLESVKQFVLQSTSCEETFVVDQCKGRSPGTPIALKGNKTKSGKDRIVVDRQGSRFGVWGVRAVCGPELDGAVVEVAAVKKEANLASLKDRDFIPDPVSGVNKGWRSIYPENVQICSQASQGVRRAEAFLIRDRGAADLPKGATFQSSCSSFLKVTEGPSDAVECVGPINFAKSDRFFSGLRAADYYFHGVRCNDKRGWKVVFCANGSWGSDNDVFGYDNGCISNDFDQKSGVEMRIICLQTI